MLVVMENRDIAALLELLLNLEAAGGGDILQVDAAERSGEKRNSIDDIIDFLGTDAERECIDVAEGLEKGALSFHNGHAGFRSDITETKDSRAIRNDCDKVMTAGIHI